MTKVDRRRFIQLGGLGSAAFGLPGMAQAQSPASAAIAQQSGVPEDRIVALVREHFPLTPRGIIERLDLRRPIYKATAAFGHFGRRLPEFTWEQTDVAPSLSKAAGVEPLAAPVTR